MPPESRAVHAPFEPSQLADQLRALGVEPGGVLVVHTSFRAVRPIVGGPAGLIDALQAAVGPAGTVVMPSWGDDDDVPFDPEVTPASADLGVTAEVFRQLPGVRRSAHPFAFAATGPHAARIVSDPLPTPPHRLESPIGRAYELDARVLLLGVNHDANTTIHLAEVLAGVPYGVPKHCTVLEDGRPVRVDYIENDCCCARFALVDGWLREQGLQREGPVGHGHARLVRSRDVVPVVLERLARDPLIFLHDPADGCVDCNTARDLIRSDRT
ncbi:MAG TPA: AAC(3)-IV family aminoglycoside N-acetyltransferase [Vicinamibacterales bacterium]